MGKEMDEQNEKEKQFRAEDEKRANAEICYGYVDGEMAQFEEVAGTCSNKDRPDEPALTWRSVIIGSIFVLGMSAFHQWANYQTMTPYIASILVILLTHPLGLLWQRLRPSSSVFTLKEHAVILIMSNVAYMYQSVFIYSTLTTLKVLERDSLNFAYYFFFILSIQFLGFGLAGILRRFLVWPCEVIWPQNLPLIAVLRTFHEKHVPEATYSKKSCFRRLIIDHRLRFFFFVFIVAFIYQWFPLYIMPILRYFSWMCWIDPNNDSLAQLTAVRGLGMGFGGLTLDWNEITKYLGSPLILPSWALINIAFGFILIIWLIVPIVYGLNLRDFRKLPVGGNVSTDFTAISLVTAFTSFASITCVFVHTILYHGKDIWNQLTKKTLSNMGNDLHSRLISAYPTVPDWWYFQLFFVALIICCVTCDYAQWLSWYYVLLALFIGAIFTLPFGLVSSVTGQLLHNLSVYYLCLIIGQSLSLEKSAKQIYTFIAVGYVVFVQTLVLVEDMKLAHYIKVGPRPLFIAQCLASFLTSTFSIAVRYLLRRGGIGDNNNWSIFNNTKLGWTLINDYVSFFNGTNLANRDLLWAFLVGAFLPVVPWVLSHYPKFAYLKRCHIPLILVTIGWMPSIVSAGSLFTWLLLGLSLFYTVGKYHYRQRYLYLTSAALDLALNLAIIFIAIIFINNRIHFPEWWGNRNASTTIDSCQRAVQVQIN